MLEDVKIIFLDIDGVLNSVKSMTSKHCHGVPVGFTTLPAMCHIKHLNMIIAKTGAKIVISSVWRKYYSVHVLSEIFYLCGLRDFSIIGLTGYDKHQDRGIEIQEWIDKFHVKYNILSFVILDDDSDMCHLMDKLVKTKNEYGLTYSDANRAIAILNK